MIIGITGSIATGKSTVTNYIQSKGLIVIDLDKIAKDVLKKDGKCYKLIIDNFSKEILKENLEIDRKKLGQIIFSSEEKRLLLNRITHPIIIKQMKDDIAKYKEQLVFVDIPLLFETNLENNFDKIITVVCDRYTQLNRLMKRDDLSIESANNRIDSQIDVMEKVNKSDFVIDNSLSLEYTYQQIEKILKKIGKGE